MAIKTFTAGSVLTASDTNTYLANAGLVYIETLTISGATSGTTDTAFTSTYKNYRIVGTYTGSTAANLVLTLRDSSGDVTATNYKAVQYYLAYGATPTWQLNGYTAAGNFAEFARIQAANEEGAVAADIFGPQTATLTNVHSKCTDTFLARQMDGFYNATTQMVGFKISSSATLTGSFRIYGYRQA